jgi:hypothetical protein
MTVLVRYQEDGSVTIRSPYDAAFCADLKRTIPGRWRRWRAEDRVWWIHQRCAEDAIALCRSWFHDVEIILYRRDRESFDRDHDSHGDPYAVLHLRPTAPWELVEAAYQILAAHPDREDLTGIEQAYQELRQHRERKSP